MSSFPPSRWQVRYLKDLDTFEGTAHDDKTVSMEALLAIRPSEGEEGAYRFTLAGTEHIKLQIKVEDILPDKAFKDTYLDIQMELGTQIRIEKNSTCSKWVDLMDLVQAQDIDATNGKGDLITEEFLELMEEYRKTASKERSGISLRWLLGTYDDDQKIFLIAQVLPCSLEVIEANPTLKSDHTRGMLAGKFEVHYDAFDNETATGPVPTFFSSNPEDSLKQLNQDPEYAFECLQALVSKLLARREMTAEEAEEYYADPRTGDFRRQLKRAWSTPEKPSKEAKGKNKNKNAKATKLLKTMNNCK